MSHLAMIVGAALSLGLYAYGYYAPRCRFTGWQADGTQWQTRTCQVHGLSQRRQVTP